MNLFILIPCKHLDRGKSRLASCLEPRRRRALCEFFLRRTLEVAISTVGAACVRVVTGDPRAAGIAAECSVAAIADGGTGLNGALTRGRAQVVAEAGLCAGLIMPIDLPLATSAALARIAAMEAAEVVLIPDESGEGTNILRLAPAAFAQFRFAFGPRSHAAHLFCAHDLGFAMRSIRDPLLMFDVDDPGQYRRFALNVPDWNSGAARPRHKTAQT